MGHVGDLLLSGQAQALDVGNIVEEGRDGVLINVEGQVTDKDGLTLWAHLIVELLRAIVGAVLEVVLGLGAGQVDSHVATIEVATLLGLHGSLGVGSGVEVDVAESTGTAVILASDDAGVGAAGGALELGEQEGVVDLPAQVANKQSRALLLSILGLVLLGRGLGLIVSLALLGRSLGLLLGGLGVRVVAVVGVI